jgi:hypothetical protein
MDKRGVTTIELLLWAVAGVLSVSAYAHLTFITYREVSPRLDRIEKKLDCALGSKGACDE